LFAASRSRKLWRMRSLCTWALVLALAPALPAQETNGPSLPPDQDPQVFVKKGIALNLKGDFDAAIDSFNKALQLNPQFAPAFENRGESHMKQGELTDAITDFSKALQIQPEYDAAFFHRGLAEAGNGDFNSAITDFNRTIELQPESSEAFLERGRAKYLKGDADGAIADATTSLGFDSGSGASHFIRGLAFGDKGDNEKAAADFKQAASNGMAEGALWYWAAKMEGHQDQGANSEDLMDRTLAAHPNPWLAELRDFVLEKTTDTQLLADAEKGRPGENRPAQAWFFVGLSRSFSGDTNGAQQAFQQVLTVGDKNSYLAVEARRQLKELSP
jgi:lipoprotein NlpI